MKKDPIRKDNYLIQAYEQKPPFASFLPGIAGLHGIPLWCCYVNRGQCIASFGSDNKDGAIMEFYPAHTAYQNTPRTGFRTFLNINGRYAEAFQADSHAQMEIGMNTLAIQDEPVKGILVRVVYFILPGEKIGALVRRVSVKNTTSEDVEVEILDGMPAIVPYGVDDDTLKNMTQTGKAWMQVEDVEKRTPYYRVRASIADTASVQTIEAGNFAAAFDENGCLLPAAADPGCVFGYDSSLGRAVEFADGGLQKISAADQVLQNQFPCGFFGTEKMLQPGETMTINELYGHAASKTLAADFIHGTGHGADAFVTGHNHDWFNRRQEAAVELTERLTDNMSTHTADADFDAYCRYTYMDNVLRGGLPMKLGDNKIFYVYSRKHGDLERDYNYFSMLPEFYSQGNGNFRDVNQNRRCDVFFAPYIGRENIQQFYSLIQLDGYNPLGVEKITYRLTEEKASVLIDALPFSAEVREQLKCKVMQPFTPGELWNMLEETTGSADPELFRQIINFSDSTVNGAFLEGYWSDHWTYNLDLIDEYLSLYPEREREMLEAEEYTWFLAQANINHRFKRYEKTPGGLRQYHALNENTRRTPGKGRQGQTATAARASGEEKLVHSEYGEGEILRASLWEKLIVLCASKFAALDPYGMGIEMEGGKPGWYDALNGLPGLFGSSMAETYELERMLLYCIKAAKKYSGNIRLLREAADYLDDLHSVCRSEKNTIFEAAEARQSAGGGEVLSFWNKINDIKESYRDRTYQGVSGSKVTRSLEEIGRILEAMEEIVHCGIEKAMRFTAPMCPTYFYYEVTEYEELENNEGFRPLHFVRRDVPLFLEGVVRYMKLGQGLDEKKLLRTAVRDSELFDEKLQMYKICAPLAPASYELGRARAFTPGWLENESIWLHMEYKYLLEMLRSGMYTEFFEDFKKAAVPFLDPDVYGRSIYENSSFIASSANPDPRTHGRGFVARLSGSTIELISMWKLLFFGPHIFSLEPAVDGKDNREPVFAPQPALPAYLIPEDGELEACLLGSTRVLYHASEKKDYIPGQYEVKSMALSFRNGSAAHITGGRVSGQIARDIREGRVDTIRIELS